MIPMAAIHRVEIETPGIASSRNRLVTVMTPGRHPA